MAYRKYQISVSGGKKKIILKKVLMAIRVILDSKEIAYTEWVTKDGNILAPQDHSKEKFFSTIKNLI